MEKIVRQIFVTADKILNKHLTNLYAQSKPQQHPTQIVIQQRE